jgi:hypothetical protein
MCLVLPLTPAVCFDVKATADWLSTLNNSALKFPVISVSKVLNYNTSFTASEAEIYSASQVEVETID